MVGKKMSKRETVQRIIDDGHLLIEGGESVDELREAFGWLVQGHECRNPPHVYPTPQDAQRAMQRSRKHGTSDSRASA
jgi:hypothetical protein